MKKNKKKTTAGDILFRLFVVVCIILSYMVIVKTKPERRNFTGNTSQLSVEESYRFKNDKLLTSHYEKHGIEMGFLDKESYEKAASDVINNPNALHKLEAEDGDDVYYVEETNEFVILSTEGYIRTYFLPDSGKRYYDKQ